MKPFVFLVGLLMPLADFSQNDSLAFDSIPENISVEFPKNQFAIGFVDFLTDKYDYAYFDLKYCHLIKTADTSDIENNRRDARYLHFGLVITNFGRPSVFYDNLLLSTIDDTSVVFRASGKGSLNNSLKIGLENQSNLMYGKNTLTGLQFNSGYYGIIGMTRVSYAYFDFPQEINTFNLLQKINGLGMEPYPILGSRQVSYLRIGFGAFMGLNYSIKFNYRSNLFFGFTLNLFDFSIGFKVKDKVETDTYNIYTGKIKSIETYGDAGLVFRVGLAF